MTRSLQVHVNRDDHHDVSARTKRFTARGPFVVQVHNRGEGSHVHVAASGELATDSDLADANPYVEPGETLEVPIRVTTDLRPATGTVTVTTGYGRNEASVDVRVNEAEVEEAAADAAGAPMPGEPGYEDETDGDGGGVVADAFARLDAPVDWLPAVPDAAPSLPDAPKRDAVDLGTLLLVAVALVALAAAALASTVFEGTFVSVAIAAVVLTVLGASVLVLLR